MCNCCVSCYYKVSLHLIFAILGIKELTLTTSQLGSIHKPLIEHIKNGPITKITTSGLRGVLAEEISRGLMKKPVVINTGKVEFLIQRLWMLSQIP